MNYLLGLLLFLVASLSWTIEAWTMDFSLLSKKELSAIRSRYNLIPYQELFSPQQQEIISAEHLAPILAELVLHRSIKLEDSDDLIDYAKTIASSGFLFSDLEARIIHNQNSRHNRGVFDALTKAIDKERYHRWKIQAVRSVAEENGDFIKAITEARLSKFDRKKLITVYATCIAPYRNEEDRNTIMKPKICDSRDNYPAPRHERSHLNVRETPAHNSTPRVLAYRLMIDEAKRISTDHKLNNFEKIVMAKCISERALRYFVPMHHPLRALRRTLIIDNKAPEKAFFMHDGVCTNFASQAHHVLGQLDLKDQIFLASQGIHVFLEFVDQDQWYHIHPFNRRSRCDVIRYPSQNAL